MIPMPVPVPAAAAVGSRDRAVLQSRGTANRFIDGEGRHNGEGASIVSLPTPKRTYPKQRKRTLEQRPQRQLTPQELAERAVHRELLASLGDGGHLTWESSPIVMWLGQQIAAGKR